MDENSRPGVTSALAAAWANTMSGVEQRGGLVVAHGAPPLPVGTAGLLRREEREEAEEALHAPGATGAHGAGRRAQEEEPDALRTCFERDRDRIIHSKAFRRLAGKTQVFVHPADHQRTRLTHALEVAQVATSLARAARLNVALVEAIALGHDCGHGPGGHASEPVFDAVLPGGFHHAPWGADVVLAPLNLCAETLDGIRGHSWSRPAPRTPEGAVVSWADRIAYCAHDLEDAIATGIVAPGDLPAEVAERAGRTRSRQLDYFISALLEGIAAHGVVAMAPEPAAALASLRSFNYERIYLRPEALAQGRAVARVLEALVEHLARRPAALPDAASVEDPVEAAVRYVSGMTDHYAFSIAQRELDWPAEELPQGIDLVG